MIAEDKTTGCLANKVAVITGAASGVGQAVALGMAREGARVIAADINEAGLAETAQHLAEIGSSCQLEQLDVSDEAAVERVMAGAVANLGGLDILVNSAAVPQVVPFLKMTPADWRRVIEINLTGSFLCAQMAARQMVAVGRGGRIINLSSITAERAITGRGAYSVAKGGITMLTRLMAAELGEMGITVNAIAPGPVDTPMAKAMHTQETRDAFHAHLPIKRYAKPAEVAAAAVFLASGDAGYITGHTLKVDGGFTTSGMLFDLGEMG
jgi:NAD(P)-dependent dehydrogenase (short-subunit alcohol dehydrogenase family)